MSMDSKSYVTIPDREGVIAKSKWGSSTPAAIGIVTTLYATAHNKFWCTLLIVARARSTASTTCQERELVTDPSKLAVWN